MASGAVAEAGLRGRGCTWESKAGFSIWQLTNTHMWFLTMKSFTLAVLFFLLMDSTRCLRSSVTPQPLERVQRYCLLCCAVCCAVRVESKRSTDALEQGSLIVGTRKCMW